MTRPRQSPHLQAILTCENGHGRVTRIIHEDFYCNHRYAAATSRTAGGLAARTFHVLLGTGALLFGACPRLTGSGTGTAEDGGASPPGSARPSRLPSQPFHHEPPRI